MGNGNGIVDVLPGEDIGHYKGFCSCCWACTRIRKGGATVTASALLLDFSFDDVGCGTAFEQRGRGLSCRSGVQFREQKVASDEEQAESQDNAVVLEDGEPSDSRDYRKTYPPQITIMIIKR